MLQVRCFTFDDVSHFNIAPYNQSHKYVCCGYCYSYRVLCLYILMLYETPVSSLHGTRKQATFSPPEPVFGGGGGVMPAVFQFLFYQNELTTTTIFSCFAVCILYSAVIK